MKIQEVKCLVKERKLKMKNTEKLIEEFKAITSEPCGTFDLGIIEVDPERIIALNLDVEDIKYDYRMKTKSERKI